jgi:hypothetical protein
MKEDKDALHAKIGVGLKDTENALGKIEATHTMNPLNTFGNY